jgi:hypothetical protein
MLSTKAILPLTCPRCQHDIAILFVTSRTRVKVTCAQCHHAWDVNLDGVPDEMSVATLNRTSIRH